MFDLFSNLYSSGLPDDLLLQQLEEKERMLRQKEEMIDRKWRKLKKLPLLPLDAALPNCAAEAGKPLRPLTQESISLEKLARQRKMDEQEAEILAMEYEAEIKKERNALGESENTIATFEELFYDPNHVEPALQLLRGKVIDDENRFITPTQKGYKAKICAWIVFLRDSGIIKEVNNKKTAKLCKEKLFMPSFSGSYLDESKTSKIHRFEKLVSAYLPPAKKLLLVK